MQFQAFAWFILATICIVLYYVKPASVANFSNQMTDEDSSFVDLLSFCLYTTLLGGLYVCINVKKFSKFGFYR